MSKLQCRRDIGAVASNVALKSPVTVTIVK